jgi:hypothetical protein
MTLFDDLYHLIFPRQEAEKDQPDEDAPLWVKVLLIGIIVFMALVLVITLTG